jgi:4-diphosphocytidyl-2-C-methyl-D-erythritol kinase
VLKALSILFDLQLSNTELEKYALQLGADCPFFIENTSKYVAGIGEKMFAIDLDLSEFELKFIFPDLHISTAEAYGGVTPDIPEHNLLDAIKHPIDNWKEEVRNDFEVSAFAKYPQLAKMKAKLYADGAIYASMTGSGSVIYGVLRK